MKIVDVCAFYTPRGGGVRTYVEQKLRIGAALGHEIVIVAPGDEDGVIERGPGARIITLKNPRFPLDRKYWYFASAAQLHDTLDELAPDYVEATSPWRSAGLVADWQGSAPRSLIMHADPLSAYAYRWFGHVLSQRTIDWQFSVYWDHLRRHAARFDHVVCANPDLSRRLAEGRVPRTVSIPMGVQPGRFSPENRDAALRARLLADCDLPESASLLLGVGRLAAEKRWPLVIDAVNAASQERPIGLVVFGEGRERRMVVKHIAGNPHVRLFTPERNGDMFARILASADALIHGSEAETFGMAAAEARASGIPVIVPNEGGAADHASGGAGTTYAARDPAAASRAILSVLAGPEHQPCYARTSTEHFAELFALYERTHTARQRAA